MASGDVYGLHLTLRLSEVENRAVLGDPERIGTFLCDLVQGIGMRILAGPLTGIESDPPENAGCSGVVILYESHAAIHTYSARGEMFLDIFSCKPFEPAKVRAMLASLLGSFVVSEESVAERGLHWGTRPEAEIVRWRAAR
jgi:S-adenosylmethionine decarboxylase